MATIYGFTWTGSDLNNYYVIDTNRERLQNRRRELMQKRGETGYVASVGSIHKVGDSPLEIDGIPTIREDH